MRKSRPIEKAGSEIRKRLRDIGFSMAFLMRKLRKKSSGASIRAFFVIPSEGEEWREWDERHGRPCRKVAARDRKSTRLNSSHVSISYAVFCLKKKKQSI